ncbi:hypothetical protein HYDPIDRAFT_85048 [Hydnomerulius pinastri MD-312]|nr:hypothetical protein HYDPIDRAFT_85867 [Hydnomerulius pinastri MD-312]KIJ66687.1 hypothetical protein HYDPIDRAFT_85048 [Hydnomerulius pinastri MD-312]
MELGGVADVVRSYPWKCIECKTCEICQEKGDDARILFCDFCDRGWHMDCLQPPLEEEPPGQWHCPRCPLLELFPHDSDLAPAQQDVPHHPTKSDPKGKGRATSEPDSEVGVETDDNGAAEDDDDSSSDSSDSDSDDNETAGAPTPRRPQPVKRKKKPPKRKAEPRTPRPAKRMRIRVRSPAPPLIVRLRLPPKGKGKEREEDVERNIFEDLLAPAERDTSKTNIDNSDRVRFDKSRDAAEEKLAPQEQPSSAIEVPATPVAGPSSRPLRSAALHQLSIPPSLPTPSPVPSTPSLYPSTPGPIANTPTGPDGHPTLRIRAIRFGPYDIHPWYDAPFPEEYANIPDGRLWICEFCLKYMRSGFAFGRHRMKCKARHPPGDEIYRDSTVSIFEVDGRKNKIYCQNLCLLSKMFLDHKSLFYDVEPFLFYVMTEIDDVGARFVGYFSKEKCSPKDYNVSCIMTLPVRQRQGWGNYLIDFSYLLSKKEQRAGSPEKPLSGLGALGYKNYWTLALMRYLRTAPHKPTLEDISRATSMTIEDIYNTLIPQNMISVHAATQPPVRPSPGQSFKFPRGRKNGIARRHLQRSNTQKEEEGGGSKPSAPFVAPARYEISWDREKVEHWLDSWEKKGYLKLKPEKLKWTPFVLARTKANGEVLQAEMGFGVGAMSGVAQAKTPATPLDTGTPMMNGSDPVNSSVLVAAAEHGNEADEDEDAARNASETPAARLFDDLPDATATPKKQLRSRLKEGNSPRSAYSRTQSNRQKVDLLRPATLRKTRSDSARPMMDDSEELRSDLGAVPDGTLNGTHQAEVNTPTVPIKRRRGRPPRVRLPDAIAAPTPNLHSGPSPTRPPSPSKPASPRKRRRISSPIPENPHAPPDLPHNAREVERVDPAAQPQPHLVNGQNRTTNGIHRDVGASSRHPSDMPDVDDSAEPPVGTAGEAKEMEHGDRLPDDGLTRQEHSDVKSEDLGTPLTGLTSRHSVPSDDTVFVSDGVNGVGVRSKDSGEVEDILASPNSPGQQHRIGGEMARDGRTMDNPAVHVRFIVVHHQPNAIRPTHRFMDNSQSHGDPGMAFGHLPRDPSLQSSVSNVSSLNQALGSHLTPTLSSRPTFHDGAYRLTDSPPTIIDPNGTARSNQAVAASSHSPIHEFTIPLTNDGPATNGMKRKHTDGVNPIPSHLGKRRRDGEDIGDFDSDPTHGSKHWTEDEKTKLFTWLMGPGEDEHWNALRTTKNSCFRECAVEVFGGKKTYQALKGCYERNFNLFKQIYSFESFHLHAGNGPVHSISEGDRLREYERRIQLARKGGCDVGNLNARTIDHWHRTGWYTLFYRRWNGDPATTRTSTRHGVNGVPGPGGTGIEEVDDDDNPLDISDPVPDSTPHTRTPSYSQSNNSQTSNGPGLLAADAGSSSSPSRAVISNQHQHPVSPQPDQSLVNFAVPQNMMAACLQLLQAQSQHSKLKLDYLRRREEREEKESSARQEIERLRLEREQAEWEHNKESIKVKQRAQLATELLGNPVVDGSVRQAAVDYLKKLFATD